jgi:hypothetical protein
VTSTLKISQKGGAGSGNFQHSGRPGLVGGSTSTGVAVATYAWLKERITPPPPIMVENLDMELDTQIDDLKSDDVLKALVRTGAPLHHFGNLQHVVSFGDYGDPNLTGFHYVEPYDKSHSIIGCMRGHINKILAGHELGHHVMETLHDENSILMRSGDVMKAAERAAQPLHNMGLRKYSLTYGNDFAADTYKVGLFGHKKQQSNLLKIWNAVIGKKFANIMDIFDYDMIGR